MLKVNVSDFFGYAMPPVFPGEITCSFFQIQTRANFSSVPQLDQETGWSFF